MWNIVTQISHWIITSYLWRGETLSIPQLDETRHTISLAVEAHKKCVKAQYDQSVNPHIYSKCDLVLVYDQANDKLGAGKFKQMWHGPYIAKRVLAKGAYELIDYDDVSLDKPINGLYLKRYYAWIFVWRSLVYISYILEQCALGLVFFFYNCYYLRYLSWLIFIL